MNLVVHLQKKAINKHGYEWATRQAWKCGIKANLVKRVIGIFKGQIVCVVEGCRAELSTPINNPLHDDEKQSTTFSWVASSGSQTTSLLQVFLTLCLCTYAV